MKSALIAVPGFLLLVAGCSQTPTPPAAPKPPLTILIRPIAPAAKVAPTAKLTWTKSIVPGGFMFKDEAAFREYLQRSEIVAIGTMTLGEKYAGKLHVERVLRGQAEPDLLLPNSRGFVPTEPEKRVIALISTYRGELTRNSLCPAGGIYPYSEPLADYIAAALQFRPL